MGTVVEKLKKILDTKKKIRDAINDKGVEVADSDSFSTYPDKILDIQTSLHGKYNERVMSTTDYTEFLTDGNINVVEYEPIEYSYTVANNLTYRSNWINTTKSEILNNFLDFFTVHLSYSATKVYLNSEWQLKIYKENEGNGFLVRVNVSTYDSKPKVSIRVEVTPIISGELQYSPELDGVYTYKYSKVIEASFPLNIYQQLYFVKSSDVEAWGFGFMESKSPNVKSLIGCTVLSKDIETNEGVNIHGLKSTNVGHSGTTYEYYIWSDRSVDFTHAKSAHLSIGIAYKGEYMYLAPLYFEEEGLICDKCFVTIGFPEVTKTLSFIMNRERFFSMKTNTEVLSSADHTGAARLVFKE